MKRTQVDPRDQGNQIKNNDSNPLNLPLGVRHRRDKGSHAMDLNANENPYKFETLDYTSSTSSDRQEKEEVVLLVEDEEEVENDTQDPPTRTIQ